MTAMTRMARKIYLSKSIIWKLKWYKNVDFFKHNFENIFGVIHQRIRDGLP